MNPKATVRIRIQDADSGCITPAMICLTGRDGEVRLPPDGRILARPATIWEYFCGIRFAADPDWIGPVRKMSGPGDNRERSYVYDLKPSVPYWREPVQHYSSGDFTIELPPGPWRIAVERGVETIPVVREFVVAGNGPSVQTIELHRWIDLPKEGWWSGDIHVHHPMLEAAHRDFLLHNARAADLHVVNVLEMGDRSGTDFKQEGFGAKFRVQQDTYALVPGQEEPRGTFGHIIGLNVAALARNELARYEFYDLAFNQMRRQQHGAVIGYAHFAWNGCDVERGLPWYITTGELDFVELFQFARLNTADYYDYLNLGFKLAATAGSDIPWASAMGEVRTFVYTGPGFDIEAWFAGLKAGHTFVSNGPALEIQVDDQLPGTTLVRQAGDTVKIVTRVRSHPAIGLPKALTLVGNEGVIQEVFNPVKKVEITLELDRLIQSSQWLAASTVCENGAVAHTTPVYIQVNGRSHWDPQRGPAIIAKQLTALNAIARQFDPPFDDWRRGVQERLQRAREFYADLLQKMTGV